jgi:hypothetical protein
MSWKNPQQQGQEKQEKKEQEGYYVVIEFNYLVGFPKVQVCTNTHVSQKKQEEAQIRRYASHYATLAMLQIQAILWLEIVYPMQNF